MKFSRSGIILCTFDYKACVAFYRDAIGLPVMFEMDDEHSHLTCFNMTGSYLMIETGGSANPDGKSLAENPVWLRFNVDDVEETAKHLAAKGIPVRVRKEVWGTVADFQDPDGNRCSLRDEATFGPPLA